MEDINKDNNIKPWKAEQLIKVFEFMKNSGLKELFEFAKEEEYLTSNERKDLYIAEVPEYINIGPSQEAWYRILKNIHM